MGQIRDTHNKPKYDLLALVMKGILVIPHSNADSERIFSQVCLNQTEFRPNMGPRRLQSILIAKTNKYSEDQHVLQTSFCDKQNGPQLDHCKVLVRLLVAVQPVPQCHVKVNWTIIMTLTELRFLYISVNCRKCQSGVLV